MAKVFTLGLGLLCALSAQGQTLASSLFVEGLEQPVQLVPDPTDRERLFVVELPGTIRVIYKGSVVSTPFLDLRDVVNYSGEGGLLSLAFAPDYRTSGKFYVNMNVPGNAMEVARYVRSSSNPGLAEKGSRHTVLRTERPSNYHNGATIRFGPDGYLYVGMGDGGGVNDPNGYGQNRLSLLGKLVRIDPRTDAFPIDSNKNYAIPLGNPFVDAQPVEALHEIWAFGLRNPWKFSFDEPRLLGNGALVIGDVGQYSFEELNYQPPGIGGLNYGWRVREGDQAVNGGGLAYGPDTRPALAYGRDIGAAVTAGSFYRGVTLGLEYFGRYFFGDFTSGRIFSCRFWQDSRTGRWLVIDNREHTADLGGSTLLGNISGIDADYDGELYVCSFNGTVRRIARPNATWLTAYAVSSGRLKSGSMRHLLARDGVVTTLAANVVNEQVALTTIHKTNWPAPSLMDIDIVGNMKIGSQGLFRLSFRRWTDNTYVQVRAYNIDSVSRRYRVTGLPATDFIRSSDGRIECRISVETNNVPLSGKDVTWDQVWVRAR